MRLIGDWSETGTKEELETKIGNGFKVRPGWTESDTDTVICLESPSYDDKPRYSVTVWNETGIRTQLAHILGMKVHRIEQERKV